MFASNTGNLKCLQGFPFFTILRGRLTPVLQFKTNKGVFSPSSESYEAYPFCSFVFVCVIFCCFDFFILQVDGQPFFCGSTIM